jgi:hypothetical protein
MLQIKSPLSLDIYNSDQDEYLLQNDDGPVSEDMKAYLGKEYEVHSVLFEGNLGQFDN